MNIASDKLFDASQLCTIRKSQNNEDLVAIRSLDGSTREVPAKEIVQLEEFEWKKIERVYSSGHVFLDPLWEKVYLIEIEKHWVHHFQFTGWSPKEITNLLAMHMFDGVFRIDLWLVDANAKLRTKNRTSVDIIETYNTKPTIDRVLIEKKHQETWEEYWSLVCLIHYLVKKYDWELMPQIWVEAVIWWAWILISDLWLRADIAPNVEVVVDYLRREFLTNEE